MPSFLEITSLAKHYGAVPVLKGVSLTIEKGEFITLLGPSGSGKTTLLTILAGFESPSSGGIFLDGRNLAPVAPHKRNIGVVFQNYALFPNMSVGQNIGYPLKLRGERPANVLRKVHEALSLVELDATLFSRSVTQISGGQRQRVALARALVFEPTILLLDEPLSALDKRLRDQMQVEIRRLHDRLNVTTICVTHDQTEALTMSDRVAVLRDGVLAQVDSPRSIYERPRSRFVAEFIGQAASLAGVSDGAKVEIEGCEFKHSFGPVRNGPVYAIIRPERLQVLDELRDNFNHLEGTVERAVYQGDAILVTICLRSGQRVTARQATLSNNRTEFSPGDRVLVGAHILDTIVVTE